jgi:spermidine synthase
MALTVGIPCGIATQMVLNGVISTPRVLAPYTKEICDPLREQLEREGIAMVERCCRSSMQIVVEWFRCSNH